MMVNLKFDQGEKILFIKIWLEGEKIELKV
jgi:hypothetical protein